MRFLVFLLAPLVAACSGPPSRYVAPPLPPAAPAPPTEDPSGALSPLLPSRDVVLDGTSIVGRWGATAVIGNDAATADLQSGVLRKVLVVNPTGQAILRGLDRREAGGLEVSFSGRITGATLRLADLPGAAALYFREGQLHLTDPGGTTTVYTWQGR